MGKAQGWPQGRGPGQCAIAIATPGSAPELGHDAAAATGLDAGVRARGGGACWPGPRSALPESPSKRQFDVGSSAKQAAQLPRTNKKYDYLRMNQHIQYIFVVWSFCSCEILIYYDASCSFR